MRELTLVLALSLGPGCTGSILDGSGAGNMGPGNGPSSPGGGNTSPGGNSASPGGNPGGSPNPGNNPGGNTNDPPKPPSAEVVCPGNGNETIGLRALRRLTIPEFEATIRTAFGLDAKQWPGLTVPPDTGSEDGFTNNVDKLLVSPDYAKGAMASSRAVSALVAADPVLTRVLPCAATGGQACADTFISTVGPKLYRRPLTPAEKMRYLAFFDPKEDFKSFVHWTTSTMLQSPNVMYRSELGERDGNRWKLTPYEVATELAYTFTGGPPSDQLMQLAAANKLGTADEVEAAARSLIYDGQAVRPAFREIVLRFTDQWLGLSRLFNAKKDATLYPEFNPEIQDSMMEETRRFFSSVIFDEKGTVASLMTAPHTFVDARLAKYYGFGAATGTDFVRVNKPPTWGVGFMSQGSMLSVLANGISTSPTRRGHVVRSTLLCTTVPPPPPVVDPIPEPTEAKTTRQRYEELHASNIACSSCHKMMDPIGFAFEHLDPAGRFRQKEGMFDIDDSAVITGTSKGDLNVKGPGELANALATLPELNDCMAAYLAAYALGLSHDSAQCLVSSATAELRKGGSIVDFYLRMARSEHFRLRQ